jgi:hypothetical protein
MENISFYYLFGQQAVDQYNSFVGTADDFRDHLERNNVEYYPFEFIYGVTAPSELLYSYDGWQGYHPIPKEFYDVLRRRRIMSWNEVQNSQYDASGTDNPESVLWYRGDDEVYTPLF